jgi:hypothetical protein
VNGPDELNDVLDIVEPARAQEEESDFHFAIPALPPVITQVLLPWVLTLGCLGCSAYIAVSHVLALPGRPVGLSMVGVALLLYAALLVPLTLKSIHSAAITAELRLPNVVWFQTFSLLSLPTAGLIVGYDAGGTGPMITLGVLGLVAMSVLMAFMFRASVMQTLLTAFYAGSAYVAWAALCVGILVGTGLILNHAGLVLPWGSPTEAVAQADKPAASPAPPTPAAPVAAPVVTALAPVAAPAVVQATPAPVVPKGPAWLVPVEPVASTMTWPALENTVRESIEVITPVTTSHAVGGAPFVALIQPRTTAIFDLRTGKRSGFIKTALEPSNLILSSDGTMLAGIESAAAEGNMFAGADGASGGINIYSTADGQLIGRVPGEPSAAVPVPLAFAGKRLIASGSSGMSGLQAWDPATGLLTHQWSTPSVTRASIAISNSGRFIAVAMGPTIRIFDVASGDVAGELSAPISLRQLRGIAFAPDGKTIAAVVPAASARGGLATGATATLVEWNVADGGALARTLPIDLTAAAPVDPMQTSGTAAVPEDVAYLQWTPDGRMLRVGGGLFEATSGKAIFTLAPQMSGNLSGRLISVACQRATYEFLPTGIGSHLLLKSVDLPAATINSAVSFAAASLLTPSAAGPVAGATASEAASMAPIASSIALAANPGAKLSVATTSPSYSALIVPSPTLTAANPHATVQLALKENWDVQVKSISRPDPAVVQAQLAAQNEAVVKIESRLQDATVKYDQVSRYQEGTTADGEIVRQYQYSDELRTSAHALLTSLEDQLRQAKANVIKLQRTVETAPVSRTVLASLDDGIPVEITSDSDISAAFVDAMHPGDRSHITGLGQVSQGVLVVKLRTALPVLAK